jgi:hypothetical protein
MMTKARSQQVCLEATPYYHCLSRCVRKAFLCGVDFITKQSYEYRRGWLEETIIRQADVFAIVVAAYAVMSNHYHVVLHINKNKADSWSLDEVIERWHDPQGTLTLKPSTDVTLTQSFGRFILI